MADKKKAKPDFRKVFIRIMCVALAFLMVFSLIASVLSLL